MSDWFSSKLRAAESILQKIDQQAAESLRKNEKGTLDGVDVDAPARTETPTGSSVPLKEQFKKKASDGSDPGQRAVSNLASFASNSNRDLSKVVGTGSATRSNSSLACNLDVAEGDWTELLGSPTSPAALSPQTRRNGASGRGGRNSWAMEFKRNPKMTTARMKAQKKLSPGVSSEAKVNGIEKNEGNTPSSSSEGVLSLVDFQNSRKVGDNEALDRKDSIKRATEQLVKVVIKDDVATLSFAGRKLEDESCTRIGNGSQGKASSSALNLSHDVDQHGLMRSAGSSLVRDADKEHNVGSDMETDSASSSDSGSDAEREREESRRRMREKILAEKVAAKVVEYIRERENMVAKLEGEKQSLEKIVEERAKQQVKEASELQTIMMETLEAAELEKQKHNNTRMEAFARLAKLETTNADLAKALAAAQGNLEVEVKRLADLRQQFELKEVAHGDLRRRISKIRESGTSIKQESTRKTLEVERELLEAECAFIADKIGMLEQKAQHLSENIEVTRKEMEEPTEVEVELKRRLGQLTDHLIQKQAQVEALSSEKATLSFRIETVSRMLAEGKSTTGTNDFTSVSSDDVESGKWESSLLKSKPTLEDKLRSGKQQLGMLLRQLDAIFLAGSVYLRRHPPAKLCFVAYLTCLHLWVIYIFKSHSRPSRSSATMSLENINGN